MQITSSGRVLLQGSDGYELAFAKNSSYYFYFYNDNAGATGKLSLTGTSGISQPIITFTQDTKYVGIGTTSPIYKFDVYTDDATIYSASTIAPTLQILRNGNTTTGSASILQFRGANSNLWNFGLVTDSTTYGGNIIIQQRTGASTYAERMRITSSGNVGIGTSSPSQLLHVNGTSQLIGANFGIAGNNDFANYAIKGDAGGSFLIYNWYSGHIFQTNSGVERMRISSNGNVVIGTTNTGYGNFGVYSATNTLIGIANSTSYSQLQQNSSDLYLNTNLSGAVGGDLIFRFGSSSTERMRITSGGNVGINCTPSAEILEVQGNIKSQNYGYSRLYLQTLNGASAYGAEIQARYNYDNPFSILGYGGASLIKMRSGNARTELYAGNSLVMALQSSRLLVNTTDIDTATASMEIYNATNAQIIFKNTSKRYIYGLAGSDSNAFNIYDLTTDQLYFSARSGGQIRFGMYGSGGKSGTLAYYLGVDSNGYIIETSGTGGGGGNVSTSGTTTDQYIPRFDGTTNITNSIISQATGNSITINGPYFNMGSGGYALNFFVNASNGIMSIGKASSYAIHMNQSNLVGINTTSFQSGNTLTCDGNAYFIGVVSASSYVTLSDIRLKTDVVELDKGLNEIIQLAPKSYKKDNSAEYGLIAQEVESILPQLVHNKNTYKSLKYMELIPIMVNAIKELKAELDELKK